MASLALSHFVVGDGPRATVLLHGFLGSGKNLRTLAVRWAERSPERRFLLPDLAGHGASPPLPPGGGLDELARAVLETAEAAGFAAPLSVVGHSLGGRVALAAARVAPERLADVTALDIGPGPVDPRVSETRRVLDVLLAAPDEASDRRALRAFLTERGLSAALADWLLMNVEPRAGRVGWRIDRRALEALHDRFNREDLWPVVTARPVPLRFVRGGRSAYLPAADAMRLEAAGCPVVTFAEAGHFLHVDALDPLVDFLAT